MNDGAFLSIYKWIREGFKKVTSGRQLWREATNTPKERKNMLIHVSSHFVTGGLFILTTNAKDLHTYPHACTPLSFISPQPSCSPIVTEPTAKNRQLQKPAPPCPANPRKIYTPLNVL